MKETFSALNFIKEFVKLFPYRQGAGETAAGIFLAKTLNVRGVDFKVQKFSTILPDYKKWSLRADGKKITCQPVGLISGKILNNHNLSSSLISSQKLINAANINFNPACEVISPSNHYFAPALAINRSDLQIVARAKKIKGEIIVQKKQHTSFNILVGNTKKPRAILFAHYDSLGLGATDDASGIAVLLKIIFEQPRLLKNNLLVLAGNEEVSYDSPIYWGHGYREFEKKFKKQLEGAKKILVVDCVGNDKTFFTTDSEIISLGFPIKNQNKWQKKISMWYGSLEKLMAVYHSELDTPNTLKEKYLEESYRKICQKIS